MGGAGRLDPPQHELPHEEGERSSSEGGRRRRGQLKGRKYRRSGWTQEGAEMEWRQKRLSAISTEMQSTAAAEAAEAAGRKRHGDATAI